MAILDLHDFEERELTLESVFLDPNNPRFISTNTKLVSDDKITDSQTQKVCMEKITEYEIKELKDSIKSIGFLPIDKIVVRPIKDNVDKYVVLEGNRRIAALKLLKEEYYNGEVNLDESILNSILRFNALVYVGREEDIEWIIQGVRHISGPKNWKPYQQAKLLSKLVDEKGMRISEAAETVGIGRTTAARLLRSYYGYLQAEKNEEYGDQLNADKFSFFQEAIFNKYDTPLQIWLEWSDDERIFKNLERLNKFLSWILVEDESGSTRLPRSVDTRDVLNKAIERYPDLFRKFEQSETQKLANLQNEIFKVEDRPQGLNEWLRELNSLLAILEAFPIMKIKTNPEEKHTAKIVTKRILETAEEILKGLD